MDTSYMSFSKCFLVEPILRDAWHALSEILHIFAIAMSD